MFLEQYSTQGIKVNREILQMFESEMLRYTKFFK